MLYAIIGMLVIIADQWIKFWVAGHLTLNEEVQTIIPGILSLVNVHNDGAAFGFLSGSGARIPFIILAGVFAVVVIIALATKLISGKLARWSIVLVTAGGLSNCLDRVIYGYVQDMFKFDFINFPVFNLADVFITVFAVLFALAVIFGKTRKDEDEDDFFDEDEEEEEEEAPRVSRRKQRREKRRAAALEEAEEEEEEPAPVKKAKKLSRKQRKAAEAEEAAAAEAPAPKKAAKQPAKQEDPFADWDRANAKVNAVKARRSEVVAAASKPAAKPAAPVQKQPAIQEPVLNNAQVAAAASAKTAAPAAAKPAAPAAKPAAAPAPKPAAKPAPKPVVEEEFSLDDILNEFK